MPPTPPTDAELDTFVRARLALIGIDLNTLPVSDPAAPTDQTRLLASLRSFLRGTPAVVSTWEPVPDPRLAQQVAVPELYPSITATRTAGGAG
jgi:hypothetical protein